jgi:hypothetical protein
MEKVRLQVEGLDDRLVPALLGGGNAAVDYSAPVITVPAAGQTVTAPAQADAGLTTSTNAPGH